MVILDNSAPPPAKGPLHCIFITLHRVVEFEIPFTCAYLLTKCIRTQVVATDDGENCQQMDTLYTTFLFSAWNSPTRILFIPYVLVGIRLCQVFFTSAVCSYVLTRVTSTHVVGCTLLGWVKLPY